MKAVQVRDLLLGNDIPKICIPIVGTTKNQILNEIEQVNKTDHDLIELRIDYFEYYHINSIIELLKEIREIYFKPIIFTLRTKDEGGMKFIDEDAYFEINNYVTESELVDLIDIELFKPENKIKKFIETAHKSNIKVILSNHDFSKTPDKEEILSRMLRMQLLGADISKIAVMPTSESDILTLLSVSLKMKTLKADRPFIALSMGSLGTITRVASEFFGSCITYASLNKNSAPGQLSVEDTREVMRIFRNK
ncbi:type I 3-dehydroquinate dehydratase [Sedimentibacter sp.]|uniref:type I 3-dehydroquinate dehydratase n=1 Tax=Sedimentibacter sp. TaxID=1960295 RepID=UPI0028AEBD0D|nr:type I 3-dehydroquinate dehydratase [Sedimentibacter sp.]